MKKYFFLILSLFTTLYLNAQDSIGIRKSISFAQGFNHVITKDLYRSPYIYRGISPYIDLAFERTSDKSIHRIHSGFTFGPIKTSFSPLASSSMLNVDYSYLRRIMHNKRFNFYLGPQLEALSWRVNYFPEMNVPPNAKVRSYLLGFSAGLAANLNYKIGTRSQLNILVSSPICTFADRPNFLDGSPRQTQFGMFNLGNPKAQLTYEYMVSDKVSIYIKYQYQYLEYSKPKAIRMLTNGLSFGVKFKL